MDLTIKLGEELERVFKRDNLGTLLPHHYMKVSEVLEQSGIDVAEDECTNERFEALVEAVEDLADELYSHRSATMFYQGVTS